MVQRQARVVDVEVVELPADRSGGSPPIRVVDPGLLQQVGIGAVLVADLLLDAVGAEARDLSADVEPGP